MKRFLFKLCLTLMLSCFTVFPAIANEGKPPPFYCSSWFWTFIQSLAIIISLIFIYRQIRLQRIANMVNSFDIYDKKWESIEMLNARKEACSKYLKNDKIITRTDELVLGFFEDLGVYSEKRVFDLEIVWGKYSQNIIYYWSILEPGVSDLRKSTNDLTWYEDFQTLSKKIIKHSRKRGITNRKNTEIDLNKFANTEVEYIEKMLSTCSS